MSKHEEDSKADPKADPKPAARAGHAPEPAAPVGPALPGQRPVPTGPVPAGHKRVKAKGGVVAGGRTYGAGDVFDISETDLESVKASVEAV